MNRVTNLTRIIIFFPVRVPAQFLSYLLMASISFFIIYIIWFYNLTLTFGNIIYYSSCFSQTIWSSSVYCEVGSQYRLLEKSRVHWGHSRFVRFQQAVRIWRFHHLKSSCWMCIVYSKFTIDIFDFKKIHWRFGIRPWQSIRYSCSYWWTIRYFIKVERQTIATKEPAINLNRKRKSLFLKNSIISFIVSILWDLKISLITQLKKKKILDSFRFKSWGMGKKKDCHSPCVAILKKATVLLVKIFNLLSLSTSNIRVKIYVNKMQFVKIKNITKW